ncbi:MAG: outer membrane lipoprotein carrier protein LolA [Alphaproteobacteria bacterium]|nr:outer membrane lipoprotein carrier protein LolA [Alphaproteobacteria bacterium]MDE2340697.1 outer membrane lipoprotein carrier protein LolA [Alphaproteobacteria bacterium]
MPALRNAKEILMRWIATLTPFVITLSAAPAGAATIADVQAHLRAVTTMTAHFSQTDRNGKTLSGTLKLKRPDRVRFSYEKGSNILIVANGKTFNFIDYGTRQVSAWPVGNSPLAVLLDPARDISKVAHIVPGAGAVTLVEARDARHPEFGTLTLAFSADSHAPGGLSLQGWVIDDSQGNRTVIHLADQAYNVPVSDEAFSWRDPRTIFHNH